MQRVQRRIDKSVVLQIAVLLTHGMHSSWLLEREKVESIKFWSKFDFFFNLSFSSSDFSMLKRRLSIVSMLVFGVSSLNEDDKLSLQR